MSEDQPSTVQRSVRRRLVWSVGVAAGAVVGASLLVPSYGQSAREGSALLQKQHTTAARTVQAAAAEAKPHAHPATTVGDGPTVSLDGHAHNHNDPQTKNSISRTTGDSETADTADPTTPVQAAVAATSVARQRSEPAPRLVPLAKSPARRAVPQNRYAMASGCYALQAVRNDRWVARAGDGFTASRAYRSRALPLHFQASDLGKYLLYGTRKDFVARQTGRRRPERPLDPGRVRAGSQRRRQLDGDPSRRGLRLPARCIGPRPGRGTRRRPGPLGDAGALPAAHGGRLRRVARGARQHRWPHLQGHLADPGGARSRRRAHPRHGVRVPRRRRALRPALAPVRRHRRPQGLPRPLRRQRQGRGARGPAEQRHTGHRPRPGRVADLQGLAGAALLDPRGHLLQVDGALLARWAADLHEPARRERQALPGLPAQAQLVRRHDLDPPAGQGHAQAGEVRRRAVRRPGQGLVPHRHEPLPGPQGDQPGQARGGHGHRDQRAVRLHHEGRRPGPVLHQGLHRPAAHRGPQDGRLADGAGQQVRQRALRRGRRRGPDRRGGELRELPGDRVLLGHAALPDGVPGRRARPQPGRRAGPQPVHPARRALRRHPAGVRRHAPGRAAAVRRDPALQQPRPHRPRGVHHPRDGQAAHALRPRPHERRGPQEGARPGRVDRLPRRRVEPLVGHAGRVPPHLQARRLHHAVRRRQHGLRREVEEAPRPGPTRATTSASGTAPT